MRWKIFGSSVVALVIVLVIGYYLGRKNPAVIGNVAAKVGL